MSKKNRTLAIIKPDAYLMKESIIELTEGWFGLRITNDRSMTMTKEFAEEFYKEHKGKEFFERLINFMTSGPCYFVILEFPPVFDHFDAVQIWRDAIGPSDPQKCKPGQIRFMYGNQDGVTHMNAVHGSDSHESAEREIAMVFNE